MHKKSIKGILVVAALTASASVAYANPITDLYNTGVDTAGAVLPNGQLGDPHYTMVANVPLNAVVMPLVVASSAYGWPVGSPWLGDNAYSRWIGPVAPSLNGPVANYDYQTTFNLNGLDPSTAVIRGRWSTDNDGIRILLNGVDTGNAVNVGEFTTWTPFSISTGFIAGTNTLDFIVNNACCGYNPTGLRVEMTGMAAPIPEPETYALMLAGLGLLGIAARRKKSA